MGTVKIFGFKYEFFRKNPKIEESWNTEHSPLDVA